MLAFQVEEVRIAIYNVGGKFYATSNVCTHAFALLTDGWLDDEIVECPLHGGQFDVRTGKAQGGIVLCDVKTFEVKVIDGVVHIGL